MEKGFIKKARSLLTKYADILTERQLVLNQTPKHIGHYESLEVYPNKFLGT
jgi:hypothetical protein